MFTMKGLLQLRHVRHSAHRTAHLCVLVRLEGLVQLLCSKEPPAPCPPFPAVECVDMTRDFTDPSELLTYTDS